MKQKSAKELSLYLLLSFGLAWLCQVGGCMALLQQGNVLLEQLALVASMFCPLAAVLLVSKGYLHQPTGIAWKPKLKGNVKYLLLAWFAPAVFTALGAALYFATFPSRLDTSGSYLLASLGGEWTLEKLQSELGMTPMHYLFYQAAQAVSYAPLINMIPAIGEEAGWRGYMMPRLKERFGLLNGRLLGGMIWGIWHWPLMLLIGYEYGTNYLGAPILGLAVWCVFCFALNTLLDVLYEKTECIWFPAIAHGAINAIAALPMFLTPPENAYYTVLGPMPIGLISMLPMLAAAVWLTIREEKKS